MLEILLVIHIFITLALVALVLLQKSEGGALGMGGGSAMGGLFTSRGAANAMTKTTSIFATLFIASCILLAIVGGVTVSNSNESLFEEEVTIEQPEANTQPSVPTGQ